MSLKFLAVGQSIAGIRNEKSPYALRKDGQLPVFPSTPRFAGKPAAPEKAPIQTDWLERPAAEVGAASKVEIFSSSNPTQPQTIPAPEQRKRRWFSFFGLKWFRTNASKADLVQSELSLEKVRVIRNDLVDSDLELVRKKRKKAKPLYAPTQSNNSLARPGWTELAARLFELGQK
jgi:hypothetical protein